MKTTTTCVLMLAVGTFRAFAADISMTGNDGYGTSSFNSGNNWPSGARPANGNDYHTGKYTMRTPDTSGNPLTATEEYVFAGDKLYVDGTDNTAGALALKTVGTNTCVNIPYLFLWRGNVAVSSENYPARVKGTVWVDWHCNVLPVNSSDNWCARFSGSDNTELWLEAALTGPKDVYLRFHGTQTAGGFVARLKGDNSGYPGRFMSDKALLVFEHDASLGAVPPDQQDNHFYLRNGGLMRFSQSIAQPVFVTRTGLFVDSSGGGLSAADGETVTVALPLTGPGPMVKVGGGTLYYSGAWSGTGTLAIQEGAFGFTSAATCSSIPSMSIVSGAWYAAGATGETTTVPGHLSFAEGSGVLLAYDAAAGQAAVLAFAPDTAFASPLKVRLTTRPAAGQRVKLLTVPVAAGVVTERDFEVDVGSDDGMPGLPKCTMEVESDGTTQTIYATVRNYAYSVGTGDNSWYSHVYNRTVNGARMDLWSDRGCMVDGKDYLLKTAVTLRAGQADAAAIDFTFPCSSITLALWNSIIALKCYSCTIPELFFNAGEISAAGCVGHTEGQNTSRQYLDGRMHVNGTYNARSTISGTTDFGVGVRAEIVGSGYLSFRTSKYAGEGNRTPTMEICRANPQFLGSIQLTSQFGGGSQDGMTLRISDPLALGGARPTPKIDSLQLNGRSFLYPETSMTINAANAGVYVEDGGFNVPEGVTLTVRENIRYAGTCIKDGKGTFALDPCGSVSFGGRGWDGVDGKDNLLLVREGAIKPLATNSFDRLRITVTKDGMLALDSRPEDADVAAYGLFNGNTAAFTLPDGVLNVRVDVADGTSSRIIKVPVCTVADTEAGTIRGKLSGRTSDSHEWYISRFGEDTVRSGYVTFSAFVEKTGGLCIYIK